MEKKSVTKRIVTIDPDGTCQTQWIDTIFRSDYDVADEIATARVEYAAHYGVQSIEEAENACVLSILYRDGTLKMISYTTN